MKKKLATTDKAPLNTVPAFINLTASCATLALTSTSQLFALDPERFAKFSQSFEGLLLDFSKQKINQQVLSQLLALASERGLEQAISDLYAGAPINTTEQRAALHTDLRRPQTSGAIAAELIKMQQFIAANDFKQVINIGIGGSDLGPQMASRALQAFALPDAPQIHFISNTDADSLHALLSVLKQDETLCIISSKSFTTLETLALATKVIAWYQSCLSESEVARRLVAVTSNAQQAQALGVSAENIFNLWDFVGGRYSLWSAIGLPLALTIGYQQFNDFLSGAHALDQHFASAPFAANLPVLMALIGILNINFYKHTTLCVIPYSDALELLPAYLQQLEMESNGKQAVVNTAPIVWGSVGCNSQHAFMQLLHQGTVTAPVDFILPLRAEHQDQQLQDILISSCLAQARALLTGETHELDYKSCPGDKPSTLILVDQLTPYTLGQLIALYEHKVFVQGVIWGINSFDQWGVQLGKVLNQDLLALIASESFTGDDLDSSTLGVLQYIYKSNQTK